MTLRRILTYFLMLFDSGWLTRMKEGKILYNFGPWRIFSENGSMGWKLASKFACVFGILKADWSTSPLCQIQPDSGSRGYLNLYTSKSTSSWRDGNYSTEVHRCIFSWTRTKIHEKKLWCIMLWNNHFFIYEFPYHIII